MRTIAQIDAELARLKAEKRALKPVISIGPAFKRSRSFRPEGDGQRQPRERDNAYLAFLRRQPCRIGLGRPAIEGELFQVLWPVNGRSSCFLVVGE